MKEAARHFSSWDAVQKAMPEEIKQDKKFWWVIGSLFILAVSVLMSFVVADTVRTGDTENAMLLIVLLCLAFLGLLFSVGRDRHIKVFPVSWDTFYHHENRETELSVPLDRRYVVLPVIILIMSIAVGAGSLFWQVAPSKSFLLDRETREVLPMPRFGFIDTDKYQVATFNPDYYMGHGKGESWDRTVSFVVGTDERFPPSQCDWNLRSFNVTATITEKQFVDHWKKRALLDAQVVSTQQLLDELVKQFLLEYLFPGNELLEEGYDFTGVFTAFAAKKGMVFDTVAVVMRDVDVKCARSDFALARRARGEQ